MTYYYTLSNFYSLNITQVVVWDSTEIHEVEITTQPIAVIEDEPVEDQSADTNTGLISHITNVFRNVTGIGSQFHDYQKNVREAHKQRLTEQFENELVEVTNPIHRVSIINLDGCDLDETVICDAIRSEIGNSKIKISKLPNAQSN